MGGGEIIFNISLYHYESDETINNKSWQGRRSKIGQWGKKYLENPPPWAIFPYPGHDFCPTLASGNTFQFFSLYRKDGQIFRGGASPPPWEVQPGERPPFSPVPSSTPMNLQLPSLHPPTVILPSSLHRSHLRSGHTCSMESLLSAGPLDLAVQEQ